MADAQRRKLATILSADVAQYSAHVEANEERALLQLAALRRLMDGIITTRGGRIANTAGDSVIADFPSTVDAVEAAIEIQDIHRRHNMPLPQGERLSFRIGINIGDVVLADNGDLLGNGVNVAARLQTLADPGGICLSENVHQQISGHINFPITKVGEHFAKNMQNPIRVYAINNAPQSTSARFRRSVITTMRRPAAQFGAIATLALVSLSAIYISIFRETVPGSGSLLERLNDARTPEEALAFFPDHVMGEQGASKYFIIRTPQLGFEEAILVAGKLGGKLASITSQEENDFLYNLSISKGGFWRVEQTDVGPQADGPVFGLFRSRSEVNPTEGWIWASGEPVTYTNWRGSAPQNAGGSQWFAQFRNGQGPAPSNGWDDIDSKRGSFIVEVEKPH